jgi:trehalose 6-phosphate synthase
VRLIVTSNRGPIRKSEDGWEASIGGMSTALMPVLKDVGGVWVAMQDHDDMPIQLPYPEDNPQFTVRSVPLSQEEEDNYYYGMSNTVLWPVSHYMIQHFELKKAYINTYRSVNERFAEAVVEEYQEDDVVWIQDYHLMIAPKHVREARPDATIGHFWHIPWPAMEVFRILPWSRELLRGMLGSDLIGFHVREYVDNFLESCRVLLGAEVDENAVYWEGREVRVQAHPIGIEYERFQRMSESDIVQQQIGELRDEVGSEHLVVGIDRLDYTKGILSRLEAFEQFLDENPEYHGQVSFYQVATPSRTEVESYKQLKREVDEAVGRINGAYSTGNWTPVHYRYRTYTQHELCTFYRAADVALLTPLRDGMNLVTQEFVAANEDGMVILSELTGAAYLLPEAIQINPYDPGGLAASIKEGLEMSADEKHRRMGQLKERVADLDVHVWADGFLEALQRRKKMA